MYLICSQKEPLLPICDLLDKSRNSVYFNKKYQCYAIRVKSRLHKKILKNVYGGKQ